jgi:hypothetical protein
VISDHPDIAEEIQTIADRVTLHQDFAEVPGYADHIVGEVKDRICRALDNDPLPTYTEWSAIERLLDQPSGEAPARERVIA